MTSQKYNRNKQEYEDLDEICNAPKDGGMQNGLGRFAQQPHRFSSDTAIHLTPERIRAEKFTEQIAAQSAITGSIPCLFRLGSSLSTVWLDNNSSKDNEGEQSVVAPTLERKYTLWLTCYIFFYALYLVIGASVFQFIETPAEQMVQANFYAIKKELLEKYPQIAESDLQNILTAAVSATSAGVRIATNETNAINLSWNFGDYILFTTSMVTTIGYGHISPISKTGKIFCIIYACIGIPLTLVLLSTLVEHLFQQSTKFLKVLITKFGHTYKIFNIQILHLIILAIIFSIVFLFIPAVIFARVEPDWSVLEGFYFCFTSLTTIGLGDIVPDANDSKVYGSYYKMITSVYLIVGLVAIMLVVTVFYTIPQLNIGVFLINSNPAEVELASSSQPQKQRKCYDKNNIPTITIESPNSSSKTLGTVL